MRAPSLLVFGPLLLAAAGIVFPPGTRLHVEPDVMSVSNAVVDEEIELEPLEERDGWVLVRYDGFRGWVRPGVSEPLLKARGERAPREPLPQGPDFLAEGRALLGNGGTEITLERWRLLTDVADAALLDRLSGVALDAPRRFEAWWSLRTDVPASGPAVFLFSRSEAARSLDPLACGRVRVGVVTATLVPGDPDATIRGVLHQLGHLYAIALLPSSPPWLEEGLADSFAALAEHGPGLQDPLRLSSRASVPAAVEMPPLASVLAAGREMFADDARGRSLRLGARSLARYCWNGSSLTRLNRFRTLVCDGLAGKTLGPKLTVQRLGADLPTLDRRVRSFREPAPSRDRATW